MHDSERYPFIPADSALGEASLQPYLPLTLIYQGFSVSTSGLLDTGSMVNVLPYQMGVDLGALKHIQELVEMVVEELVEDGKPVLKG